MEGIAISKPQDMGKAWNKPALLYNVYAADDGDVLKLKLPNKYVVVRGIEQNFEKNAIAVRAKEFIALVQRTYDEIREHLTGLDVSESGFDFAAKDVLWTPPVSENDGFVHATFTKSSILKHIGRSHDALDPDTLRGTVFNAYVVLTMPLVYVDTATKKVSIPVHVKTVGIAHIEDDLRGVDVSKLTLSA